MNVHTEENIGLTTIYIAEGVLRAMVVRSALESAGIPVMLSYESVGPTYGITIGKIGQVKVMVPTEWSEEATRLLETEPRQGEVFSVPPDVEEKA